MARIPHIDDSIMDQDLGMERNNDLLQLVFKSPKIGEAFAHLHPAHFTGLALSPKLRELLILHIDGEHSRNMPGPRVGKLRSL
jgi:hypothetical protein